MTQSDREPGVRSVTFQPGCGMQMFLTGALAMAGGIYLMNEWNDLAGLARASAVVLVVLGTFLMLPMLLSWAFTLIVKYTLQRLTENVGDLQTRLVELGEKFGATTKPLYEKLHTFRAASEEDFDELDRDAYDLAQEELSSLGFRHLGDIVDQTIEEVSGVSTVSRLMASTDGTTGVGFCQFDAQQLLHDNAGKLSLILDFDTEFTDGTFLLTTNTKGLDLTTAATGIDRRQYPLETPIPELARYHETEKQKLMAAKAGRATCVVIHTLDDALESGKRQQATKNAFRKDIGYVDPEEVRRIVRNSSGESRADFAARAADVARKQEQEREQDNG